MDFSGFVRELCSMWITARTRRMNYPIVFCRVPTKTIAGAFVLPYKELLQVLYDVRPPNFCELCMALIPVHGTSVSSVCPCHYTRGTGTTFLYLGGTFVSSVRPYHNTRNFCQFWKTSTSYTRTCNFCEFYVKFIPVSGTSVSSVRLSHNTRGAGTPLSQYTGARFVFECPINTYPDDTDGCVVCHLIYGFTQCGKCMTFLTPIIHK